MSRLLSLPECLETYTVAVPGVAAGSTAVERLANVDLHLAALEATTPNQHQTTVSQCSKRLYYEVRTEKSIVPRVDEAPRSAGLAVIQGREELSPAGIAETTVVGRQAEPGTAGDLADQLAEVLAVAPADPGAGAHAQRSQDDDAVLAMLAVLLLESAQLDEQPGSKTCVQPRPAPPQDPIELRLVRRGLVVRPPLRRGDHVRLVHHAAERQVRVAVSLGEVVVVDLADDVQILVAFKEAWLSSEKIDISPGFRQYQNVVFMFWDTSPSLTHSPAAGRARTYDSLAPLGCLRRVLDYVGWNVFAGHVRGDVGLLAHGGECLGDCCHAQGGRTCRCHCARDVSSSESLQDGMSVCGEKMSWS